MCTKNHKHMRYSSRGTECDRIFVILGHFCPFNPSPLKTRKPKLWKNEYSIWRSHHFKLSNKKHDHVMYAYSDMECNGYNFLSFQAIFALLQKLTPPPPPPYWPWKIKFGKKGQYFCPFTPSPLKSQKMKISKMKKNPGDIIFYTSVPKIMIIPYTVPEIWCMTDIIVIFILGNTFPF